MSMIVCTDNQFGISKNGNIPWKISEDLKFFKQTTMGSTVIMGRKTYESIGCRSLPGRTNFIISTTMQGANVFCNLEEALKFTTGKAFIIGGSSLYNEAMEKKLCQVIYLNVLNVQINNLA